MWQVPLGWRLFTLSSANQPSLTGSVSLLHTLQEPPASRQPSLPCSLHRLCWLGQGQTRLGTAVAAVISLTAVSLFQVVLKEHHSEPSGATAETGGKC